jgi:hypothetical protein
MVKVIVDFLNVVGGMDEKGWWLSKTQWFNIISLIVLVGVHFGWISVGAVSPTDIEMVAVALIPVVNMILRAFTKVPLTNQVIPDGEVVKKLKEK